MYGGTWLHIFGDSLGLMVVFKCSMMTSSVWGEIATCFWGLLGMDGCIQMFGGVDMAAAFCFSIVCLSYLVPFGEICST